MINKTFIMLYFLYLILFYSLFFFNFVFLISFYLSIVVHAYKEVSAVSFRLPNVTYNIFLLDSNTKKMGVELTMKTKV